MLRITYTVVFYLWISAFHKSVYLNIKKYIYILIYKYKSLPYIAYVTILHFLSDTVIELDTLSRRKVPLYAGNNSHEQISPNPLSCTRERATSKRPMTANVALFDAGSGDLINALSTNHTAPPTVTCRFNTVKLPFPNKTLSACLPPQISSHPSELWTAGAQNRSCVRHVRNKQKSHAYIRVHRPRVHALCRVNASACVHYRDVYADALPVKPLFPFTSPIFRDRESTIDISPSLHKCKISGFYSCCSTSRICSRRCRENASDIVEKSEKYNIIRNASKLWTYIHAQGADRRKFLADLERFQATVIFLAFYITASK